MSRSKKIYNKKRTWKKMKGGDCGCSRITGGSNFFEPTSIGGLNNYSLNQYTNDPIHQTLSTRTQPDIPFSARGGKKDKRSKKRYRKGGNGNAISNNYVFDKSIIQAQTRFTGGKRKYKKGKTQKKYKKKGGDMLNFYNSNPITSFGSMNGLATSNNILYGLGQPGDAASYNAPLNNPYSKYYI
jgi:hypothetical protein